MLNSPFHGYTDDEVRELRSCLTDCESSASSDWPKRLYMLATQELSLRGQQRKAAQRLAKAPLSRAKHLFQEAAGEVFESCSPYAEWHAH